MTELSRSSATPSNTAPAKYTSNDFKYFGGGIDSLYLSYNGQLRKSTLDNLDHLKKLAQNGPVQVEVRSRLFEVKPKAPRFFRFCIADGDYNIMLSYSARQKMPVAQVQVRSHLCHHHEPERIDLEVKEILHELADLDPQAKVSRVDLHNDFATGYDVNTLTQKNWVCRADKLTNRFHRQRTTGWSAGEGGAIMARLYDKTLELQNTESPFIRDYWRLYGWTRADQVWRLEFQLRRDALKEFGILHVEDLPSSLRGLWAYLTEEWLRLAVTSPSDDNRARWRTHPLWSDIQRCPDWCVLGVAVQRRVATRTPDNHYLMVNGLAPITSFMAKEGLLQFETALRRFGAAARRYHSRYGNMNRQGLDNYILRKVTEKRVRYGLPPLLKKKDKKSGR